MKQNNLNNFRDNFNKSWRAAVDVAGVEVGTKDECWYRLQLRLCLQVAWSPGEAEPGWTLELSTKIREDFTIMEKASTY